MRETAICKICGLDARFAGRKQGNYAKRPFTVFHCDHCRFSFIQDPELNYAALYSEDYYSGKGADPSVQYLYELTHPQLTIRQYEWRGILRAVRHLAALGPRTRWLDYGCGNGGLVRYCRTHADLAIAGFEEGWIRDAAAEMNTPLMDRTELSSCRGSFDVVTAIEVLEHTDDPLAVLKEIRALLRPGGLLFYTTGNARPYRDRLLNWSYVLPEVHISFFEPETLSRALRMAGFTTEQKGFFDGFEDIIRFKVLKNLGVRDRNRWERAVPWNLVSRMVDRVYRVSDHPIAWAPGTT